MTLHLYAHVSEDRLVRLPDDVPLGEVEIIVLSPTPDAHILAAVRVAIAREQKRHQSSE
jgi:hypothetical protein